MIRTSSFAVTRQFRRVNWLGMIDCRGREGGRDQRQTMDGMCSIWECGDEYVTTPKLNLPALARPPSRPEQSRAVGRQRAVQWGRALVGSDVGRRSGCTQSIGTKLT
ncbi:hypothetical protein KC19_4G270400 [Ceratodon purpureus]|uniref:Uncharacterized protein n=1 Tax=Ceratodon purpureus TaxID=3225 RepID=A0A8T0IFI6_CERPU|nr:hypothetical protein KC19_4G270400 [Ceratodon purpureus]